MPASMGGGFGGEWIHVYIWLNPFAVHLKLPHIVNRLYPNAKKKKFQVWGKNVYYHLQAKKEALVRNGISQYAEGGGRRVQDEEHRYTCGGFISIFGKTNIIL